MMNSNIVDVYYTSDLHVGHANVIKYCNRPYNNKEEMNEAIIEKWNSKASPGSVVYHLGDFCFWGTTRAAELKDYLLRLNGQIRIVWGNHDNHNLWYKMLDEYPELKGKVQILGDIAFPKINGQKIFMCHYPMISWNGKHYGAWHMFGHVHGTMPVTEGLSMDVGIDSHPKFEIYSHDEVVEIMSKKSVRDGHYSDYHASDI